MGLLGFSFVFGVFWWWAWAKPFPLCSMVSCFYGFPMFSLVFVVVWWWWWVSLVFVVVWWWYSAKSFPLFSSGFLGFPSQGIKKSLSVVSPRFDSAWPDFVPQEAQIQQTLPASPPAEKIAGNVLICTKFTGY
jgi:hypothetical protein